MLYSGFREKIRSGIPVCGCAVNTCSPGQVEQLGILGFDFAVIDNERGPFSDNELLALITAGDAVGLPCLVRVCQNSAWAIQHVMDCGAVGVIIPDCSTPQLAQQAFDGLKFAPLGSRSLSASRAAEYGLRGSLADYVKTANRESVLVCRIDSPQGAANAEALAAMEEIDVLLTDTAQLAFAMGFPGHPSHPQVLAAVERVKELAKKHGRSLGIIVGAGESAQDYIDDGYEMPVGSGSGFFTSGAKEFLSQLKTELV